MTLAHPMAVLPLRGRGLPTTALVIGSMVPDVPVFVRWYDGYRLSHSAIGIFSLDLFLAAAVTVVWFLAVRDAVVDMAPAAVRRRLPARARPSAHDWLVTPLAAAVGAATHVVWDSFTHADRWGPRHIKWLATDHHGLLGLKWAQYGSGVVGLAVVTVVAVRFLAASPPLPDDRAPAVLPAWVLPTVVGGAAAVGIAAAARKTSYGVRDMAFDGVVDGLVTLVLLGALACVAWHVARATRSVESPT